MKLHRRRFMAGVIGALFVPASRIKAEPVIDTETVKCEYFIAKHPQPKKLVFIDGKEVHEVFEMLAAKEPGITVPGFVKCYVRNTRLISNRAYAAGGYEYNRNSRGSLELTTEGNKEFATLKTIRMDGKIRWELID